MSRFEIALIWIAYLTWVFGVAGLLLWLSGKIKAKVHRKVKTVQPQVQIEVYGKNYKRLSESGRTLNKVI